MTNYEKLYNLQPKFDYSFSCKIKSKTMEYQTFLWTDPDGDEYLLVRTNFLFGTIFQGGIFQNYLKNQFQNSKLIPLIVDEDRVHTNVSYILPFQLKDKNLDEFLWETHEWGADTTIDNLEEK